MLIASSFDLCTISVKSKVPVLRLSEIMCPTVISSVACFYLPNEEPSLCISFKINTSKNHDEEILLFCTKRLDYSTKDR